MNGREAHLRQAEHNERVFQELRGGGRDSHDWQVTILFYTALHYVDAALDPLRPWSHAQRIGMVRDSLPEVFNWYLDLKNASNAARYDMAQFEPGDVSEIHLNQFLPLKDALLPLSD